MQYLHTHSHMHIQIHILHTCTYTHTYIHTYTQTCLTHTGAHPCTYTQVRIHSHAHKHTCAIHRYIFTHTQIHRYTCTHIADCLLESLSRGLSLTVDLRSPCESSSVLNRNLAWVMIQHCRSVVGVLQFWDREYHFLAVNTPPPFDSPQWKIHCLYAPLRALPPTFQ